MASFYDVLTGKNTDEFELGPGDKALIGLSGGDPNNKPLRVTSFVDDIKAASEPDPAVSVYQRKGLFDLIYEIDGNMIGGRNIRAVIDVPPNAVGVQRGDYAKPAHAKLGTWFSSRKKARRELVNLARSFVGRAHYLWGTAGNSPPDGMEGNGNKKTAAKLRDPGFVKSILDQDKILAVNTACCTSPVYSTCAGRSKLFAQLNSTTDVDGFIAQCDKQKEAGVSDQKLWPGFGPQKLFPRVYYFRGEQKDLVWGESCVGVPHFDCIGLVNYCYGKGLTRGLQLDIENFNSKHVQKNKDGTTTIVDLLAKTGFVEIFTNDIMDADIVIPNASHPSLKDFSHIGMVYKLNDKWFIVQATDTIYGLTDNTEFIIAHWHRFRLAGNYFRGSE